jgi:hypothetical protein
LENIDAWLIRHSVSDGQSVDDSETVRLGAGAYHIEESPGRNVRP